MSKRGRTRNTPRRRRRNTSRRERRRSVRSIRRRKHRSLMILEIGKGGQGTNARASGGPGRRARQNASRWRRAHAEASLASHQQKGTSRWRWRYARLRPCSGLSHQRIPHRGRRRGLSHQRIPHIPQRLPQAFGLAIRTNWTSQGRLWLAGGFTRSIRCGRRGHGQDPCQNFFMKEAISVGSGNKHGMRI